MESEGCSKMHEVVDETEVQTFEDNGAIQNSGAIAFQKENANTLNDNKADICEPKMEVETIQEANEVMVEDNAMQQESLKRQISSKTDRRDEKEVFTEKNKNQETSINIVNSVESSEASTSQGNTPTSSNGNESCPSRSDHGEVKKCQANGESGTSMEKPNNSSDEDSSKRQKLYESVCGRSKSEGENLAKNSSKFHKLKSKVKQRNYRSEKKATGDIGNSCAESASDESETREGTSDPATISDTHSPELKINFSDSSDDDDVGNASNKWASSASEDEMEQEQEGPPPCLKKEKPKPSWFVLPELFKREIGSNPILQRRYYGSLHVVERFELMYKMNEHQGCVNALNFNQKGNLIASGSDDLNVVLWDWALGKKHHTFTSGHRSNLFQAKWLPFDVEYLLATCARDGEVRLLDIRRDRSRKIAKHHAPAHKLTVHPNSPNVIISVGEDAKVLSIDIRDNKPTKLLVVEDDCTSEVQLYTVHSNPLNENEFCVGGRSQTVWVYDQRKISTPLHKLCPQHLAYNKHAHVTCAVYNHNGTEVLASYNDEDIYLFDTASYKTGEFAHRYQGHRNSATVKGVNFFGPKSEFVISGSDCGNIFIWDKNTEAIVNLMPADEQGVVNCLEPHPHIPVLATSGLDSDVKIWMPSCETAPDLKNLQSCVKSNAQNREEDRANEPERFYGQMLWILLRHVRDTERVRVRNASRGFEDGNTDDDDDVEDEEDDDDYNADDLLDDSDSSDSDSQSDEDGTVGVRYLL